MATKTTDRAGPGYRGWYQKMRQRALLRLEQGNKDQFRALLAEEKLAEPFVPAPPEIPQCRWIIGCPGTPVRTAHHPLRGPVPSCDGHAD